MLYEIGIGLAGIIIGFSGAFLLTRKKEKPEETIPEVIPEPEPEFTLKFMAILDYVNPMKFLNEIQHKKSLIITIEQLSLVPYKKHKFLADLKKISEENDLVIKTISQDIYLLTSKDTPIEKEIIEVSPEHEDNIEEPVLSQSDDNEGSTEKITQAL